MPGFSSNRERRLWVWALAVVVAIYATADLARTLADALRESGLLELVPTMFSAGMLLIGIAILVQGLRERSRGVEVGFALGVAAIAVIGFARGIAAAERSHLIEYAVLALIIHEALVERKAQGWRVPVPAVLAIADDDGGRRGGRVHPVLPAQPHVRPVRHRFRPAGERARGRLERLDPLGTTVDRKVPFLAVVRRRGSEGRAGYPKGVD